MYNIKQSLSTYENTQRLMRAIADAAKWHCNQIRKGTEIPYIAHPFGVLALLQLHMVSDEDILIAGVLHDCLEDTNCTVAYIESTYGKRVAKIIQMLSESDNVETWESRKKYILDHLKKQSYEIKLITLADKLHNLMSIAEDIRINGEKTWLRFAKGKDYQRWYFSRLSQVFSKDVVMTRHPMVVQFVDLVENVFHIPHYPMPSDSQRKLRETESISSGEGFITSEIPYLSNTIHCGSKILKTYCLARDAVANLSQVALMDLMERQNLLVPLIKPIPTSFGINKDDEGLDCITLTLTLSEGELIYCQTNDLISINA